MHPLILTDCYGPDKRHLFDRCHSLFLGTQQLVEAIEKEKNDSKKRIKTLETGIEEEMKKDKKELIGKIETVEADIKKKVEMETNATRFV